MRHINGIRETRPCPMVPAIVGSQAQILTDLDAQGSDTTNYYVWHPMRQFRHQLGATLTVAASSDIPPSHLPPAWFIGRTLIRCRIRKCHREQFHTSRTRRCRSPSRDYLRCEQSFDFAAPINVNSSGFGGLNLPAMTGWYSSIWATSKSKPRRATRPPG